MSAANGVKATVPLPRGRWLAYAYVVAVVVGFLAFSALLHLPVDAEHWSADLVTARFSPRLDTQHKKIVLIYVSDKTLADSPYVSPIDRKLLADLIAAADLAGAEAIGLDIVLDRHTDLKKDEELRRTYRHTKAKMVLAAIDEPGDGSHVQTDYFFADTDGTAPALGHIYFDERRSSLVIADHVIRFMAETPGKGEAGARPSFAEALAHAEGCDFKPESRYIAWLLPPTNGAETFMTLAAEDVLGRGSVKLPLETMLRGKIVLIGGNFSDRDQHLTPLSVSRDDFYPGLFVHAQILAQLLAKRSIVEIDPSAQLLIAMAAAFVGYLSGRRSGHYNLWLELGAVATLVLIGFLSFWLWDVIFPYNFALITLLTGVAVGHYGRIESHRAAGHGSAP
jgi:adenylate cyclase